MAGTPSRAGESRRDAYTRPAMPRTTTDIGERIHRLRENINRVFIGHDGAIDQLICCLLARGHVLIEDVPGVGKTVLATSLARSIDCSFNRIQLTPDLLPADVLGVSVFDRNTNNFQFKRGPIFANIVLADEINRTTPRTQSALLESMNESTVSIEGVAYRLEAPFMVVATQNPYEFEGTYPLPENQLDRFLMQLSLGYPSADDEARIIELRPSDRALHELEPALHAGDIVDMQRRADEVRLDRSLVDYVVAFAEATRQHDELRLGLSTRGALALAQAARATALMDGRDYCIPEDVLANAIPVSAHRVLSHAYVRGGETTASRQILHDILGDVPSPA